MNALVPAEQTRSPLMTGGRIQPVIPQSMDDAYRLGKAICVAGMAPRGMEQPEKCMIAILRGLEVGLTPMQALDKIAVVNGRPTIWGDGAMALVRGSGLCEFVNERIDGAGDARVAVCETKRRGEPQSIVRTFSVAEAKEAGLWNKAGPWKQFPARMLQMRARAFALRDLYADVLGGLYLREEIEEDRPGRNDSPPPAPRRIDADPSPAPRQIEHTPSRDTARAGEPSPVQDAGAEGAGAPGPQASASDPSPAGHDDDGVVTLDSLLTDLDERLGFASTVEDVEEAYTDFDAEPIFSDYEGGVEKARALKAKHLDRLPAHNKLTGSPTKDLPQAENEMLREAGALPATDDFPGNDAINSLASTKDPFAIPERFKGGGHYQIFIGDACVAATKPEHEDLLRAAWGKTGEIRKQLHADKQLHDATIQSLKDRVLEAIARLHEPASTEGDDLPPPAPRSQTAQEPTKASSSVEAPPPAPSPASGDSAASYEARMVEAFAAAKTKEDVDKFWFGTVAERDAMGTYPDSWKIARSKAKNALPSEEG